MSNQGKELRASTSITSDQEAALLKVYAISEARAIEQHEARMRELRASKRGLVVLLAMSAIQGLVALWLVMWAGGGL